MTISANDKEQIAKTLRRFLKQLNFPFESVPLDRQYAEAALADGVKNYDLKQDIIDQPLFQHAFQVGVIIALTSYNHLEDLRTQYWIAIYTACLTYFDDLSVTDPGALREFHSRFISAHPQKHSLLDTMVILLRKSGERFNPAAANLVVSSTLDFMTGLILDYDHKKMEVHQSAVNYPRYFRNVMGVSTAYTVFVFPPHISLQVYVQVLPDIRNWTDDINDIFSFYKEELAGEDTNHISLLSKLNGWSKLESLQYLADSCVESHLRIQQVLSSQHPEACDAYTQTYAPGFVAFHACASKRYRLGELGLA